MSGHSDFTWWIHSKAKHAFVFPKKNKQGVPIKKKIVKTYFTADPDGTPNSDVFNIEFSDQTTADFDTVDFEDLTKRYNKKKGKK